MLARADGPVRNKGKEVFLYTLHLVGWDFCFFLFVRYTHIQGFVDRRDISSDVTCGFQQPGEIDRSYDGAMVGKATSQGAGLCFGFVFWTWDFSLT